MQGILIENDIFVAVVRSRNLRQDVAGRILASASAEPRCVWDLAVATATGTLFSHYIFRDNLKIILVTGDGFS